MTRRQDRSTRAANIAETHECSWFALAPDDVLALTSIEGIGQVLIRFTREQIANNPRLAELMAQRRVVRAPRVYDLEEPMSVEPYS